MLLRLRIALPDRPGSLGHVARTLGMAGADIVQVVVLERIAGRAIDDFTVIWPASAPVDRILAGLDAVGGVRIDGVWRTNEVPGSGGTDLGLIGQLAANPDGGVATLVDAVPGILGADWAVALLVPDDWADPGTDSATPGVLHASWRAPQGLFLPDIVPLRPRAVDAPDVHYAVAPFRRGELVLVTARQRQNADRPDAPGAPPFHRSEVERLAQLVAVASTVLHGVRPAVM